MFCGVVLGRIICKIFLSSFPVDMELFLSMPVTNPIKTHIHSFRPALDDSVSEDTDGTFVVVLKRCGTLRMTHLLESSAYRDSIFGIDESRSDFGFLDGGHDGVDDFAVDKNGCIVRWRWVVRGDGQLWLLGEIVIEAVDEVIGVGLTNNFDTEIVDDEIESCGTRDVMEESGSMDGWNITIGSKMFDELDVCKSSGLRKAVHAGADLGKELFVFDEGTKVVFLHDIFGDGPFGHARL
jgi:hypothetical protein